MDVSLSLSVIIPFYNETPFIKTAVASVLTQELESFEVIIVNDNPEVFAQDYFDSLAFPDCVRVVHHEKNRGLPSSRNTGIQAAAGYHIAFLDADDYYLTKGLRNHVEYAVQMGADITHAQTVTTKVNGISGSVIPPDSAYLNQSALGRYEGKHVVPAGFFIESSWASIYTRDFITGKSIHFDESQVKFEDRIFVIESLLAAESLAILGEPCRVWRKRSNSITTSAKSYEDKILKFNLVRKSVNLWLNSANEHARHWAMSEFVRQVRYMITNNETSPWFGCFGFSTDEADVKLTSMLAKYFASLEVTELDIVTAFDARSPNYHPDRTGDGKITPHDMFRFVDAVARSDHALAQEIVLATIKRAAPFQMDHLVKPTKQSDKVRILLHAGLHKTGTTHIQYQLAENRAVLREHGILFPQTGFGAPKGIDPVRPRGLPGHQALISSVFQDQPDMIKQLQGEVLGAQCHTVIISAENISQPDVPYPTRARRVRKVVTALSEIGDVTPVFVYRQPDSWLESYYREISGNGAPLAYQTPAEYLVNNTNVLKFGEIVGAIEDACKARSVLFSFEEALKGYDDLTFAFLDECGIDISKKDFTLARGTRYPSTCNAQLQIARLTSLMVQDQTTRQNILRTFYRQVEDTDQRSKLFSPQDRRQIVNTFCDASEGLFNDRGIASPREAWLAQIKDEDQPQEAVIPESYMTALWTSGVINGTSIKPVPLIPSTPLEPHTGDHIIQVNLHDLNRVSHERHMADQMASELDYMRNSASWRLTAPLRTVMRGMRRLQGR